MRRSKKPIVIASRTSKLARKQAEMVGGALAKLHPTLAIEYRWIESAGDQIAGPLAAHGGKGLFTKSIEDALLNGEADLAVHSLKDLPAADHEQTPRLTLAAVPKRANYRDALVARNGWVSLDDLPQGAAVGTSSPRRAAQLLRARPDLNITLLRGNVDTRVAKVLDPGIHDGVLDAAVLASAGLRRLGYNDLAKQRLPLEVMLPAACQGALAVQCRADDHVSLTRCLPLNHAATATAAHAERQLVAALDSDCHSSVAVLAKPVPPEQTVAKRNADSHWFDLQARVLSPDGSRMLEAQGRCKTRELRRLVQTLAQQLRDQGADALLEQGRQTPQWAQPQAAPAPPASAAG